MIKSTYITRAQEPTYRALKDFKPIEKYACMLPEPNEIGSIFSYENIKDNIDGCGISQPIMVDMSLERIFIADEGSEQ